MNHNYYYTLLGRRAGGPGSQQTPVVPGVTNVKLGPGASTACQFTGPYLTDVWIDNLDWQQVQYVRLDQAGTQPFAGGGLWWDIGNIEGSGTTLRIDDNGLVIEYFAC